MYGGENHVVRRTRTCAACGVSRLESESERAPLRARESEKESENERERERAKGRNERGEGGGRLPLMASHKQRCFNHKGLFGVGGVGGHCGAFWRGNSL